MNDIHDRDAYEKAVAEACGENARAVVRRLIDVVEQGTNSKMVYGGARVSATVTSPGWPYRPIHIVWFRVPQRLRYVVTRDVAFGYEWQTNNEHDRYQRPKQGTPVRSRLDQWVAEIESLDLCVKRGPDHPNLKQTIECSFHRDDAADLIDSLCSLLQAVIEDLGQILAE